MTFQEFKDFINRQEWIFAKTYAKKAPHEYIVRYRIKDSDKTFMDAVNYIQENGMTMYFWSYPNKYVYLDGRSYWMTKGGDGNPLIINRCDVDKYIYSIKWRGPEQE